LIVLAVDEKPWSAPSNVILVAGGCGRGWHRGPGGGCRPNAPVVVAPVVAPPVVRPNAPVADMLLSGDGSINAVMLDVGGFLGLGKKHVAYSYDKKDGFWNQK
jgi:hypothetical protein